MLRSENLFHLFILLLVFAQINAWKWEDPYVAKGKKLKDYEGVNVVDDQTYNYAKRKTVCKLFTKIGDNHDAIYSADDVMKGDFPNQTLKLSNTVEVLAFQCTSHFDGTQQLYCGKGPDKNTLAIYAKLNQANTYAILYSVISV